MIFAVEPPDVARRKRVMSDLPPVRPTVCPSYRRSSSFLGISSVVFSETYHSNLATFSKKIPHQARMTKVKMVKKVPRGILMVLYHFEKTACLG